MAVPARVVARLRGPPSTWADQLPDALEAETRRGVTFEEAQAAWEDLAHTWAPVIVAGAAWLELKHLEERLTQYASYRDHLMGAAADLRGSESDDLREDLNALARGAQGLAALGRVENATLDRWRALVGRLRAEMAIIAQVDPARRQQLLAEETIREKDYKSAVLFMGGLGDEADPQQYLLDADASVMRLLDKGVVE